MHGILASSFACALCQNLQAGGSVRVDLCERGKVCREVGTQRGVQNPERESSLEGYRRFSLCLNQGPRGRMCLAEPQSSPKGRSGIARWHCDTVFQLLFLHGRVNVRLGKTGNPGLLVSFWVEDEELTWQRSLFPAPGTAHGHSLRKSAGGSETPKSQGTAVPRLNTSVPNWHLWTSEILKSTQMMLHSLITQERRNPLGISHQLAEEWFWYRTGRWRNSHRRWDAHLYMVCCCVIRQPGRKDQQSGLMATSGITSSCIQIKKN